VSGGKLNCDGRAVRLCAVMSGGVDDQDDQDDQGGSGRHASYMWTCEMADRNGRQRVTRKEEIRGNVDVGQG